MNSKRSKLTKSILVLCVCLFALVALRLHVAAAEGVIVDPAVLNLANFVPPPPAQDSAAMKADLAELHLIEQARTPQQVAAAKADDGELDIFVYRSVLGEQFSADKLPATAALSATLNREERAFSGQLKMEFHRPRPYQFDSTLHPVCPTTKMPNSYPSGHTLSGYLEAFALAEMVPEKRDQFLARAADYAHNRMVCGVHYPTDLATGRDVAYAVFGALMVSPEFKTELAAARAETRKLLDLK